MKNKQSIDRLRVENILYDDAQSQAEIMNTCFQSVFTRETSFEGQGARRRCNGLREFHVDVQEVKEIMKDLDVSKALGPDGVSNWIMKECNEQLADVLHNIIVCSFKEGKVPLEWKRANIVPIHKGGSKEDPMNYRPVSLTSVVAKICERIVKNRWMKYLEESNTLTGRQFGFRSGRSCVTNLLSFYSRAIDIIQERDGWADCVYLDLKKAFDKVPHQRLLWKIKNVGGLQGKALEWITDFLQNREMRTIIKDEKSGWCKVISGVPQGTVLAPVMFLVYINDMVEEVDSYISLFADDAKLLKRVENNTDCEMLQNDLNKIYEWSKRWEMEFNANKCKVMELGKSKRRQTKQYTMGEVEIMKTKEEKDLGITISENLSPEKHVNNIVGTTYELLRKIKRAFTYMDEEMMKKLIEYMIRPRLEYAATIWSPHSKKDIRKIERIQRAATKMVPSIQDLPYEDRLKRLGLPTLQQRRERGDLIAIYRVSKGKDRVDNEYLFMWDSRDTRGHSMKLKKTACRRDVKKHSFPNRSIEIWNNLDETVVQARNIHEFKVKLDACRYGDRTARA